MRCPKCEYVREEAEAAPDWQCPRCGIAYHKFKPAVESVPNKAASEFTIRTSPEKKKGITFKDFRIAILLLILLFVALDSFFMKANTSDWDQPLRVVIYPVNGDLSEVSSSYIASLQESGFSPINQFMRREAVRYGIAISDPLDIRMGPVIEEIPPLPPHEGSILDTVLWSLNFRYWSFTMDTYEGPRPDIRIFTLFYDFHTHKRLPHSTGIEQGMLSIVHAFSNRKMAKQNNFVITHEMLHTLGATDKYNLANNLPIFPDGYADPDKTPRYPQHFAEIMGGRIPLSQTQSEIPEGLNEAIIGMLTAREIGWVKGEE
ncbi:MAG: hypothetical protein L3J89_03065 [Gammaproteobacteria bacterium]|nr:hypothetical protein [Gammaproteobacteria bacterium]